jgi:hypothetical protein
MNCEYKECVSEAIAKQDFCREHIENNPFVGDTRPELATKPDIESVDNGTGLVLGLIIGYVLR